MKQKKQRPIHQQLSLTNLVLVIVTVILALIGTTVITTRMEYQAIDTNLLNSAQILSQLPQVQQLIQEEEQQEETEWLTDYLKNTIRNISNIDLILAGSRDGVLYFTPDAEDIGTVYSGEGLYEIQQGEASVIDAPGLGGAERCALAPVRDPSTGEVFGFVAVGIYARSIHRIIGATIFQFILVAALACVFAALFSRQMSRRIREALMGYEPEDFLHLFLRQEEVMDALDEGVLAVDREGRVVYLNTAAASLFGVRHLSDVLGRSIRELDPRTSIFRVLQSGKAEHNISVDIVPGYSALSSRFPIRQDGKVVGAVATFRNRTAVTKLAEDLTGFRYMVEAMRAYTHEFMNKLHVIHGLMQMKKYDMAQQYIMDITKTQQLSVSRVMERIEDSTVAALLVGKTSRAAECGIRMILEQDSHLSAGSTFLPSAALVSILGNLIDNAIESLNLVSTAPRELTVTIRETEEGLFLCVEDTGPGIAPEVMDKIFVSGFSTKGNGRGTGLALVKETVESYGGKIRVESERNVGAVFYISFHKGNGKEEP